MKMRKVVPAMLALAMVTACGGPQKDATYENATKLREAVTASGVECPGDAVKHDDNYGEDYIKCSETLSLAVYGKDSEADLSKTVHDLSKDTYLMGTRWIIQSADSSTLTKLKEKLGGTLTIS
ncbi:hypothetical protein [Arthrobacter bambusae]|uniref:hypothetical protein n=1 Tax=Arthrobacter bambusae TaxID=1338426 RepID=UPI0027870D1B|nr:hypothetical protein [Arthrobacter bambusae]MDQ0030160.1 hypothetical protein [Arthrobacter bambusae]MDQ0097842.1 hypothetical protein [Arthrobacter bambusae]